MPIINRAKKIFKLAGRISLRVFLKLNDFKMTLLRQFKIFRSNKVNFS